MSHYENLGEHIEALEANGHLRRISEPINIYSELMALVRCQFQGLDESRRSGWLFETPVDNDGDAFDIPVAVALVGPSREIYRFNLGCETDRDLVEKWGNALENPIPPEVVGDSPVKDERTVFDGTDSGGDGLSRFPVPISTPGFDPAPFFTAGGLVTRDPETGIYNMGTYRCHLKSDRSFAMYSGSDGHKHWERARERGEPLEAAVVLGAPPHIHMVSVSGVPFNQNEFGVCGGLIGEPLELVECETIDLEVPASAEIVIEGELTMDTHPEGPFGEFTGYMGSMTESPHFEVSCITHRRDPVYQAFISQMPPSESSMIRKVGNEQNILKHLKNTSVPNIMDVAIHEMSGSAAFLVVQLDKTNNKEPWQAMHSALSYTTSVGKFTVAVDSDIDPTNLRSVVWALSFHVQPDKDIELVNHANSPLDPIRTPDEQGQLNMWGRSDDTAVLIDATRPWDFPPTSLPKQEYMEHARDLWERLDLPQLDLTAPWYGQEFGRWPEVCDEAAAAAVEGEFFGPEQRERLAEGLAASEE